MALPWRILSIIAILSLGFLAGGSVAQMEAGERGILPVDSSRSLEVGGIKVDVGGKDAEDARYNGWKLAQREGFKKLWSEKHGRPISQAPNLSDSTLNGLVYSIIVEKEQIGPNRYVATLGVAFDRARAGEMLGFSGRQRQSAPMLLVPVLINGGTALSLERRNPWQRAWAQFRTINSRIDYVRPSGLGSDPLLVTAAQTRRPGRSWWRNVLDYEGAAGILIAEARLHRAYPGGPATGHFTAKYGADGRTIGSFTISAGSSNDLPRMMDEAVAQMDRLFTRALSLGLLRQDPSLITLAPPPPEEEIDVEDTQQAVAAQTIQIQMLTRSNEAFASQVGAIRSIVGVDSVSTRTSAIGGWSLLLVSYRGPVSQLQSSLAAKGWQVSNVGGTLRVNPGLPPGFAQPQPAQGDGDGGQ